PDSSRLHTCTYHSSAVIPPPAGAPATDLNRILSNVATVTIAVKPLNQPPEAHNDYYTTPQGTPLGVAAPGVLSNDSGGTTDHALTATLVHAPEQGAFTLNADGSFKYEAPASFYGIASFTYQATNGTVSSNTATVTIYVTPTAPIVVAQDDTYSTPQGSPLSVTAPGVLNNDYAFVPNPIPLAGGLDTHPIQVIPLTAKLVSGPEHGTLTFN